MNDKIINQPIQPIAVTCGGMDFIIDKMPAVQSLSVFGRLVKVVAPVLQDVIKMQTISEDTDSEVVAEVILGIIPQVDVEAATTLIVDLCETARYAGSHQLAGNQVDFNIAFNDNLESALALAWEVAKLNYEKYVKDISQLGSAQQTTTQSNNN